MNDTRKISFCINTARNEINHIKLLFRSLEQNLSRKDHEIIVFIDSDNQNTFEWLLTQKEIFPNLKILRNELPICYGYARNINEMFEQASNEIVSYLQSDMVICKNYDQEVLKGLEPGMMVCSTRVEPPLHPDGPEKITKDFGLDPVTFDLNAWTEFAEQHKEDRWSMYFFAPFTVHKNEWLSVGGHDTIFRRSREDSDVLIRLVLNDTKIMQTWSALVYHFTCTSSRGPNWFDKDNTQAQERAQLQQKADNIELGRFISKWGQFKHDLVKPKYYNIAAYITGYNFNLANFMVVQSYFDTVYVDDSTLIDLVQQWMDSDQIPANKLLNISSEDWNEYGYMYNQITASNRIKHAYNLDTPDVVVKFEEKDLTLDTFHSFIEKVQFVIDQVEEVGTYEYGPFVITINQKVDRASDKIVVHNPQIKPEHKYTIH